MDWVWHAALIWVAVALPLALLTGHLLLRADRRDPPVVVSQSTDAHPAEEPQQFTPEPPAAPRRRTRYPQAGPGDSVARADLRRWPLGELFRDKLSAQDHHDDTGQWSNSSYKHHD